MWKMGSPRHLEMGRATRKRTAVEQTHGTLRGKLESCCEERGDGAAPAACCLYGTSLWW